MAILHGMFPGGDCRNVKIYHDRIECEPNFTDEEIRRGLLNMHYNWRCRIEGEPGEKVRVIMHWPPYDPDTVTDHTPTYWYVQSFGKIAEKAMFISDDEIHWTPFTDIKKTDFDFDFTVTIPESGMLGVSVNLPFSLAEFKAVCEEFKEFRIPSFKTMANVEVPMFRFGTGKKVIWLQANVHVIEVGGCHALVGVMRYLREHLDEIKDYSFFIIPTVSVDKLYQDAEYPELHNDINRDYGTLSHPETKAIDKIIRDLVADGYEMLVITDMHNGWCDTDISGGNLTEFKPEAVDAEYSAKRLKFMRDLLASCDFEAPETFWWHDYPEKVQCMFDYGVVNFKCLCTTMEFSRFEIWNREANAYVPLTQERLETFGRQYAEFLLNYKY